MESHWPLLCSECLDCLITLRCLWMRSLKANPTAPHTWMETWLFASLFARWQRPSWRITLDCSFIWMNSKIRYHAVHLVLVMNVNRDSLSRFQGIPHRLLACLLYHEKNPQLLLSSFFWSIHACFSSTVIPSHSLSRSKANSRLFRFLHSWTKRKFQYMLSRVRALVFCLICSNLDGITTSHEILF